MWPILEVGVVKLKNGFVIGYRDCVLYVWCLIEMVNLDSWDIHWCYFYDAFELTLSQDRDLSKYSGKMFFAWEGNHMVMTWRWHIDPLRCDEMG